MFYFRLFNCSHWRTFFPLAYMRCNLTIYWAITVNSQITFKYNSYQSLDVLMPESDGGKCARAVKTNGCDLSCDHVLTYGINFSIDFGTIVIMCCWAVIVVSGNRHNFGKIDYKLCARRLASGYYTKPSARYRLILSCVFWVCSSCQPETNPTTTGELQLIRQSYVEDAVRHGLDLSKRSK